MVTAELAVAIPALVAVLLLALAAVGHGIDTIRCADAARTSARVLARGEHAGTARAAAVAQAPQGASVDTVATTVAGLPAVRVTVTAPGSPALRAIGVPGPSSTSTAVTESTEVPGAR